VLLPGEPTNDLDSETVWFEGNYGAYIEDLKRRKGADADQPHRIKYKPLVRK
jgi:sulfate-transporting ATPase